MASSVIGAPVAPFAGLAVDFLVTSIVSVGGAMLFDVVYDNKDKAISWGSNKINEANEVLSNIGNAVSDMVSGLGSVFD
ncbi:hypothetical protein [Streptococcus zhangguiae]|uniref:Uncharacterized protein n=1 Tax=Streptococcus zhangguiae TaxID=2664091 RepID=A0A6I4REL7_9STRE|nr:hypothetical protein [Streptococcus sp. zg-70]MWV55924.1 hypothetical protein [Streptococcus sp. zg-70]